MALALLLAAAPSELATSEAPRTPMHGAYRGRPLLIEAPASSTDYLRDTHGDRSPCESGNPGYRCFYRRHESRSGMFVLPTERGGVRVVAAGTGRDLFKYSPPCPRPSDGSDRAAGGSSPLEVRAAAQDVFIATAANRRRREWRTVAVAGTCSGVVALDVTTARPQILWELAGSPAFDEDFDGRSDLGAFPAATLGRIRIRASSGSPAEVAGEVEDRQVAIFGGGTTGPWLFMVDIETGRPLYKRLLIGAAPGRPSAIDSDGDGYLDRLYVGTRAGFLYRVDLALDGTEVPTLAEVRVEDLEGHLHSTLRVPQVDENGRPVWQPRILFDANWNGTTPSEQPRALLHGPAVLFVEPGTFAVAFGTGAHGPEEFRDQEGRFYLFIDDSEPTEPPRQPVSDAAFAPVFSSGGNVTADYLSDRSPGHRGWSLSLGRSERVLGAPLSLAGATFFTTFQPAEAAGSVAGTSRVFAVDSSNGNAIFRDAGNAPRRAFPAPVPLGTPFASPGRSRPYPGQRPVQPLLGPENEILEELEKLLPRACRFAGYRIEVRAATPDTQTLLIAPIPVCLIEQHWKEL